MGTTTEHPVASEVLNGAQPLVKVASNAEVKEVAYLISGLVAEHRIVKVRAIGAGAVNQAVKAIITARGTVATRGLDLVSREGFEMVPMPDKDPVTAIIWLLEAK